MPTINFGSWSTGDLVSDNSTCVYRDDGKNRYTVTATDNSTITPNGFYLENQAHTVELPYIVKWNTSANPGGKTLPYGSAFNRRSAATSDELCAIEGLSANLTMEVDSADIAAVPAGTYYAELTIVIEPR
ncbi:MAG: hypothetical protein COB04_10880 [Gammaproteobacteria bacterium]|nr:MAG: hypothetical protein COB04_10880 [Gammaproteobacteria bacterium]